MAILSIRIIGDPILRTAAEPVTEFGPELAKLVADMFETMDAVDGAGLAAPQIGVGLRLFTYNVNGQRGYVINPQISNGDETQQGAGEGCLSVPGLGFAVRRFMHTTVTGVDLENQAITVSGEDMLARCLQHETDHLDGHLYTDRLEGEDRKAALRAIRAAQYQKITARTASTRAQSVGSSFGGLA